MNWNAELYDSKHDYVSEYGKGLLAYVPNNQNQIVLDLGCGTGSLTNELSKKAGRIIGVDGSTDMIQQAKKLYPTIDFQVMDACHLIWKNNFDVIFSNAVFHWIKKQDLLLKGVYDALNDKGRLVCEMGAFGNIAKIEAAFQALMGQHGYDYTSQFYFPSTNAYEQLLKRYGFQIELITDFDRPTPLSDKIRGLIVQRQKYHP